MKLEKIIARIVLVSPDENIKELFKTIEKECYRIVDRLNNLLESLSIFISLYYVRSSEIGILLVKSVEIEPEQFIKCHKLYSSIVEKLYNISKYTTSQIKSLNIELEMSFRYESGVYECLKSNLEYYIIEKEKYFVSFSLINENEIIIKRIIPSSEEDAMCLKKALELFQRLSGIKYNSLKDLVNLKFSFDVDKINVVILDKYLNLVKGKMADVNKFLDVLDDVVKYCDEIKIEKSGKIVKARIISSSPEKVIEVLF